MISLILSIIGIVGAAASVVYFLRALRLVRRERDHAMSMLHDALAAKAREFEEAQRQIDSLREADRRMNALFIAESNAAFRRAERAEKIAAAAAKLFNGKDDSGEFRELKEAVREWEGGAS